MEKYIKYTLKKYFSIVLIALLLLGGCSDSVKDEGSTNVGSEAKYNTIHNNYYKEIVMYEIDNQIIAYPTFEGADNKFYMPSYFDGENVHILDGSVSSLCTYVDHEQCKSKLNAETMFINYYDGHLYLFEDYWDSNKYSKNTRIIQSDIDGRGQKEIFKNILENDKLSGVSYTFPYMQFHKNKIYVNFNNKFYIGNLETGEMKEKIIHGIERVRRIYLIEETMYMYVEEYNDGESVRYDVLLKCTLDGEIEEVLYENKIVLFADHNILFYLVEEDGRFNCYVMNRKTGDIQYIGDKVYNSVLKDGDNYLLDTDNYDGLNHEFCIIDKNGNIMYKKEYLKDETHLSNLYLENRYYVYSKQHKTFGYYEIKEDGVSDLVLLEMK